ncbi:flavoprotein oxygenase [Grosmannia clavigera kw1407]|uniref:Flavoprotein oxygenase n=1 Tax=Grosmannia clavigera (strain kw1407 / UAMH 11150) TaxID=655863 RepID=F0X6Z1_GROCL|nr:flavoprotein oxygenase [Grosmannia clavigera kw1407]EFX06247.1 flavoprotein oxygenase [Grosmannia clavigera kw1407]
MAMPSTEAAVDGQEEAKYEGSAHEDAWTRDERSYEEDEQGHEVAEESFCDDGPRGDVHGSSDSEREEHSGHDHDHNDDHNDEHDEHDEHDDDVFSQHSQSERSPRSSLDGSLDSHGGSSGKKTAKADESYEQHEDGYDDSVHHHQRLPRLSGMSAGSGFSQGGAISNMSQYLEDSTADSGHDGGQSQFVARAVSTSIGGSGGRGAFRTPSARRRQQEQQQGQGETWIASPPTRTASRFRPIQPEPAPLVLLHATLMPTRWAWADVLDRWGEAAEEQAGETEHDAAEGENSEGSPGSPGTPSRAFRRLHTAWCRLQSFLNGETVSERGVLLPHPQNDFEVLEERLLEALELPVRRRARILECGHYLGPVDDDDDDGDDGYEDEDSVAGEDEDLDEDHDHSETDTAHGGDSSISRHKERRHWCGMCRAEIRYEPLRAERVFRVKVYASNGLMTAGAWAACWREMERVDVEIEPVVTDAALLRELSRIRATQETKTNSAGWKQQHESASLTALLMAAGRVILRDHKRMAITVLSGLVIMLVALRTATAPLEVIVSAGMPGVVPPVVPVVSAEAAVKAEPLMRELAVAAGRQPVTDTIAGMDAVPTTTTVETVTQRQTVQVFETVTERVTATERVRTTETVTATESANKAKKVFEIEAARTVAQMDVDSVAAEYGLELVADKKSTAGQPGFSPVDAKPEYIVAGSLGGSCCDRSSCCDRDVALF